LLGAELGVVAEEAVPVDLGANEGCDNPEIGGVVAAVEPVELVGVGLVRVGVFVQGGAVGRCFARAVDALETLITRGTDVAQAPFGAKRTLSSVVVAARVGGVSGVFAIVADGGRSGVVARARRGRRPRVGPRAAAVGWVGRGQARSWSVP